jgi:tRNA (cmo5U34)-methyltransferase
MDQEQDHGVMGAQGYDRIIGSIVPRQQELIRAAAAHLPPDAGSVLELGCGTGILTEKIRSACPGAEITGLDISQEMLDMAGKKPGLDGVRFVARDIRTTWPERHYDVIITSLCLHHVSRDERAGILQRAAWALAPEGRFICGDIFRAEDDDGEQRLMEAWRCDMKNAGAPDDVIAGMIAQRTRRMPELTPVSWFRDQLEAAGFSPVLVPFSAGFVGLVVGYIHRDEHP